uniref:Early flowering 3/high response n=2 Tax=Lathyrus oleraceus subsp. oleraceus TaxID=208194 RepID=K7QD11_PEA|nr:early flowering 3/high response [Pisum sativum subsp. sativum]
MKRGNDDEKMMGPLFPRLHVGDTEKGGPRAPPRNKMALYEQFSIPSQRFNLPLHPNTSNNSVPPGFLEPGDCPRAKLCFSWSFDS